MINYTFSPTIDRLGWLYEVGAAVCFSSGEIRQKLRSMRGRTNDRHKECSVTIAEVSKLSGIPFGTVAKAESAPYRVSVDVLAKIAKAHGKRVAIVFYDEVTE